MNKKLLFCVVSLIGCLACHHEPIPANVLPENKMVNILKDLHLVEAFVNTNFPYSDSSKYLYQQLQDSILKVHNTDSAAFDSSMSYYKHHIELMDRIYIATVDSLSLKESLQK